MAKFIGSIALHPARVSFTWYAAAIVVGMTLLMLPISHASLDAGGDPPVRSSLTWLDAAFTATSATCVTGLAVRSTGGDFSFFGQAVILAMIQLGGIGIMTVTTFVTISLGGRQSLRQRALVDEVLGGGSELDLRRVLGRVLRYTLFIEGLGFVLLAATFMFDYTPGTALWHALFHSVSAFSNAGFSIHDDSLTGYQGNIIVNAVISALIICGGIGFPVMSDIARNLHGPWAQRWERLTIHSKLMLTGSAVLLLLGTVALLALEWDGALATMPPHRRLLVAFFQSVTCRTAGFNTIDFGTLTNASLFVAILLMIVGAGPCSTGGGAKITTVSVLVLRAWSMLRGRKNVVVARRTIPLEVADRAMATLLVFSVVAAVALTTLLILEQSEVPHASSQGVFMDALFEVISALGTVGLSTGMTPHLTGPGRFVIIVLMFIGRLGPITVFAALSVEDHEASVQYAREEPLIG